MDMRIRPALLGGTMALVASGILAACAGGSTGAVARQAASNAQAAAVDTVADQATASVNQVKQTLEPTSEKPGVGEGELVVVTAKVQAVDKKARVVTLKYPDGKQVKVKCGPEVRNFAQIHVGDDVTAEFLETVELFVAETQGQPTANSSEAMQRAPLGSKPGVVVVESVEVSAIVDAIDYATRVVKLRGAEGKTMTVKAGPEVKRLNEVKKGDTVVARLTEAVSIKVTAPK